MDSSFVTYDDARIVSTDPSDWPVIRFMFPPGTHGCGVHTHLNRSIRAESVGGCQAKFHANAGNQMRRNTCSYPNYGTFTSYLQGMQIRPHFGSRGSSSFPIDLARLAPRPSGRSSPPEIAAREERAFRPFSHTSSPVTSIGSGITT